MLGCVAKYCCAIALRRQVVFGQKGKTSEWQCPR